MHFQPTLLSSSYFSLIKPVPSQILVPKHPVSILPELRRALKLSLDMFILCEQERLSHIAQKCTKTTKPVQKSPKIIELLSSDQEVSEQHQKIQHLKKENEGIKHLNIKEIEEKTDESKDQLECEKEQSLSRQQNSANIVGKTILIRKQKFSKNGSKLRKQKYLEVQQNLDLTDAVQIKRQPFSVEELNRKRQGLQLRMVLDWQQTGKNRKERREIRMLQG